MDCSTGGDLENFVIRRRIYDRVASIILRNVIIAVARGARACLSRAQFSPLSSLPPGTCASVGTVISKSLLDFDEYRVCRISCKENCGGDSQKSRKRVRFAFTEENERERESIYGLIVAQGYREPFESFLPGPRARDRDFEEEEEGSARRKRRQTKQGVLLATLVPHNKLFTILVHLDFPKVPRSISI